MKIDIDTLKEDELIDLNNRIVARLKFLRDMRSHSDMLKFRIGEQVSFQPPGYPMMMGILTRYNKKTVTVITLAGQQWNVAPGFLQKIVQNASTHSDNTQSVVIRIK